MPKRSKNFSDEEKHLLLELVKNEIVVVENKKTDNNSANQKKRTWENISIMFNSIGGGSRDAKCLQLAWQNLKSATKKAYLEAKKEAESTDAANGNTKIEKIHKRIAALIPTQIPSLHEIGSKDEDERTETMSIDQFGINTTQVHISTHNHDKETDIIDIPESSSQEEPLPIANGPDTERTAARRTRNEPYRGVSDDENRDIELWVLRHRFALEMHEAQMKTAALEQQRIQEAIEQQREKHNLEIEVLTAKKRKYSK